MAGLRIDSVSKSFGAQAALSDVSLDVADGEFLALLGPSGCGKTTMLRLVAGFEMASAGTITLGGRVVSGDGVHVPPEKRRTGIVFQSYALWPHMDVSENVAYALKVQGLGHAEREARVRKALDLVGLSDYASRRPALLSGGQRQRVALARCLAMEPDIVLLDEPLANLDAHLRASMEEEFAAFHRRTGTTMLYITHDQAEAMALADRVAVMDKGRILQAASPSALYRAPEDETVARFIGAGMILPCDVAGEDVAVLGRRVVVRKPPGAPPSKAGKLCVRAHDLAFAESGIPGRVERLVYRGGGYLAEVVVDGLTAPLRVETPEPAPVVAGQKVHVAIQDGWLLPG
jgi:iron(III) transport system ATP-binding protein